MGLKISWPLGPLEVIPNKTRYSAPQPRYPAGKQALNLPKRGFNIPEFGQLLIYHKLMIGDFNPDCIDKIEADFGDPNNPIHIDMNIPLYRE